MCSGNWDVRPDFALLINTALKTNLKKNCTQLQNKIIGRIKNDLKFDYVLLWLNQKGIFSEGITVVEKGVLIYTVFFYFFILSLPIYFLGGMLDCTVF